VSLGRNFRGALLVGKSTFLVMHGFILVLAIAPNLHSCSWPWTMWYCSWSVISLTLGMVNLLAIRYEDWLAFRLLYFKMQSTYLLLLCSWYLLLAISIISLGLKQPSLGFGLRHHCGLFHVTDANVVQFVKNLDKVWAGLDSHWVSVPWLAATASCDECNYQDCISS